MQPKLKIYTKQPNPFQNNMRPWERLQEPQSMTRPKVKAARDRPNPSAE